MDNRKKNILLGLLIVGIVSMTIAFAALTTRLSLNGTANVAATSWNIHFDDWTKVSGTTVDGHQNTATIDETQITQTTAPNITKIDNVGVTLNQPGDYIRYNFVIENEGSIDGKLSNFTKTMTPTNDVIGFTVNCYESSSREGTPITTNYVLPAGGEVYCYFEVKYIDQINGTQTAGSNQVYTQSAINASISANWTWIQSDTQASVATGSAATSGGNAATGGGNSGGNEQPELNNPYLTDFSGTYQYYSIDNEDFSGSLDPNANVYIRKGTSGYEEVCARFTNDGAFTCITGANDPDGYEPQITANGVSGYAQGKMQEMTSKGATCQVHDGENIGCEGSNGVECGIYGGGNIECSDGVNYCSVENDSTDYGWCHN